MSHSWCQPVAWQHAPRRTLATDLNGAPLSVSVGVAVFGEDGQDVSSLIETAEESRFAAAASGVAVLRATEPAGGQL